MSYAVITAGGRQIRVEPGELIRVDRIDQPEGAAVAFDQVLLCGTDSGLKVGTPHIAGAVVRGTVLGEKRDKKVMTFKKRKTKTYRRTRGHREYYTLVRVEAIEPGA